MAAEPVRPANAGLLESGLIKTGTIPKAPKQQRGADVAQG